MSDSTPASLSNAESTAGQKPAPAGRKKISRLLGAGCGLLLPLWFMLLITPCALFYLAINGEIRIWHDSVPDPHAQPRLLISLISEKDDRGLRIENASIFNPDADALSTCVVTNVRFILWESQGGNQNVAYCECYERTEAETGWQLVRTYSNSCTIAE